MPYIVRVAIDLDLFNLIELGRDYFNEVGRWNNLPFDEQKIMKYAMFAIQNRSHNIFIVVDKSTKKPIGFFWGCVINQMWTDDPIGQDIFLFVKSEYRGKGIGKMLIDIFVKWCMDSGCKAIQCGANSGIGNDSPAKRLFESAGFEPGGYSFYKKL